ncbi:unnamed protein product [Rhizophagus irregularis]|uniref:Uncharacterized protein n=1 Tax=Rhizophagus irregularis TaxID=588596 RepID=A0A915ZL05_9GLOM|nr:unnamed protein product [Rhizophagus irregularis]
MPPKRQADYTTNKGRPRKRTTETTTVEERPRKKTIETTTVEGRPRKRTTETTTVEEEDIINMQDDHDDRDDQDFISDLASRRDEDARSDEANDDRNDVNEQQVNSLQRSIRKNTAIPEQFESLTNLEICNWLIKHPQILNLANQMMTAENTSPDVSASISSNPYTSNNSVPRQPFENKDNVFLWDESIKCVFLRVRDPPSEALDSLIKKIFGVQTYSSDAKTILERTRKSFIDFQNKYNDSIANLVNNYRESKSRSTPSRNDIELFIGEAITMKVLSRQLSAVNIAKLKESGVETLIEFVRESFKVSWRGKDLIAIKSLDRITKDLEIPSRSGRNIANFLSL